ncbi:hypothetical protein KSC_008560 [Ktedonobacter sp. SOSP1-52]|uniref:hypothetical protein n=1 Tax=Ktedonobacter sp. SOSP1-52 TaxID=2778366 RepID=UPI001915A969|nr:hypothetical protein [Ktedonobacter sp. SOSP1-52]GHO61964.1 hypothetical protein KSC_008560 [Ktedonobacter sp. SOSP1-52]
MGTDISMYVEQRIGDEWYFVGQMVEDELHQYDPDDALEYRPESIYDRRHYSLFAILAGVRNDQEEPFEPIAPLRGLPDDLSAELQVWYNYALYDEIAGSPNPEKWFQTSWLTLEELARFDWYGKRKKINSLQSLTYTEVADTFFTEILQGLWEAYGPTSDVRLVFDFC